MRILMAHKFLHITGGAERYLFDLSDTMRAHGHEIIYFAMQHEKNVPSEYEAYFPGKVDMNAGGGLRAQLHTARRILYSGEAANKIEALIRDTKPDAAFLHNIYHHLSPSILPVMKKFKLPVLMHVADYKLICPSYSLVAHNAICERCKQMRFYQAPLQKCVKGSFSKSLLAGVELYYHRMTHIYERNVDYFICPSAFVKEKLVEFGINPAQLVYFPQAMSIGDIEPNYASHGYLLYFGKLIREKGIYTLLNAMEQVKDVPLVIAGYGEESDAVAEYIRVHNMHNVELVGFKHGEELKALVRDAAVTVVPSEWYEVFGLNIFEAFAFGKPVIGARIGGIPELVQDHKTGLIYDAGNTTQLAERITWLFAHPEKIVEMGKNARVMATGELSPERNYRDIMELYRRCGIII